MYHRTCFSRQLFFAHRMDCLGFHPARRRRLFSPHVESTHGRIGCLLRGSKHGAMGMYIPGMGHAFPRIVVKINALQVRGSYFSCTALLTAGATSDVIEGQEESKVRYSLRASIATCAETITRRCLSSFTIAAVGFRRRAPPRVATQYRRFQ